MRVERGSKELATALQAIMDGRLTIFSLSPLEGLITSQTFSPCIGRTTVGRATLGQHQTTVLLLQETEGLRQGRNGQRSYREYPRIHWRLLEM
jgi:hypothetical protein